MIGRAWLLAAVILILSACGTVPDTVGQAEISRESIMEYLEPLGLNVAGVADNIAYSLRDGKAYREKITDRYGHTTMLSAWVEQQSRGNGFCINFYRDEKCPDCNGTGKVAPPDIIGAKAPIAFACRRCEGTGILKNQSHRQCYMLSTEEFVNPAAQREIEAQTLPEGVTDYARQLSSDDPAERLAACVWLDENFIYVGQFFEELRPILDRAQYFGRDDATVSLTQKVVGKRIGDSGKTVYQFLAGRGLASAADRVYYRIYIDNNSGNVAQKTFVGEAPRKK